MRSSCAIQQFMPMAMGDGRQEQLQWVKAVMTHLGVTASELARRAHIAPSTLNKKLNSDDDTGRLSGRVMESIAEVAGLKPYEYPGGRIGFAEAEADPFVMNARDGTTTRQARAVRQMVEGVNGRDAWTVKGYGLELEGIRPDDVLVVDQNIKPRHGDIVCAQHYDWRAQTAETMFRLFQPPYLVTRSMRTPDSRPVLVDEHDVVIRGVVVSVMRFTRPTT